jgi:hypothetical protein
LRNVFSSEGISTAPVSSNNKCAEKRNNTTPTTNSKDKEDPALNKQKNNQNSTKHAMNVL